ncbi:MAG: hypothetical protein ABSA86_07670 [Oryzomonas sp.]
MREGDGWISGRPGRSRSGHQDEQDLQAHGRLLRQVHHHGSIDDPDLLASCQKAVLGNA